MRDDDRRLVYSSEEGWTQPQPRRVARPASKPMAGVPDDGIVRVARERRRGSIVCVVTGLRENELAEVGKSLKRFCGTGGTAKNGVVEIQGDHRDKIVAYFESQGRRAKKAGG